MSLPSHCLENSVFFRKGDYLNFEKLSNGVKTSLKFAKIPDFHTIDEESYFAAEMRIEGLKVMTAALAADDVLNIRLQEAKNPSAIRNINFFIPIEANAQLVSVEVFGGETIYIRAPVVEIPP
ncbi:uncharacterized protein LOC107037368 [Diachasma alloeum]|uniref:uncharacterized protein LOC107037368 n=1 Tax=Diachasma alloeum TaxID=454923 RepID=UPI0007383191|nr:uncharacterized protein LOC107037368 [Diachasma alloeum]